MVDKNTSATPRSPSKSKNLLDNGLGFLASNGLAAYGLHELIQATTSQPTTQQLAYMGAGALLLKANQAYRHSSKLKPLKEKINQLVSQQDTHKKTSWLKTGALALATAGALAGYTHSSAQQTLAPQAKETTIQTTSPSTTSKTDKTLDLTDLLTEQFDLDQTPLKEIQKAEPAYIKNRPAIYDSLSYEDISLQEVRGAQLAPKESTLGRIQRTLRWQPTYHSIEEKYDIPKNLLAGEIMQESYGDPLQPNSLNDGGLGLMHMQGPTAQEYGLEIFGNSDSYHDPMHGKKLKELLEHNNYDFSKIHSSDERAHLIKSLDAAARIIVNGKNAYGSWDRGVRFFRGGSEKAKANYLTHVKLWQERISDEVWLQKAQDDFNTRNSNITFDDYLEAFHEANHNWGLNSYRASPLK